MRKKDGERNKKGGRNKYVKRKKKKAGREIMVKLLNKEGRSV
jgi:hypothetical protein